MSEKVKVMFQLLLILIVSYIGSLIWWRAWMYQGLIGPIPFLHWLAPSDGEGSYEKTEIEMFIHLIVLTISAYSLVKYRNKQKGV